ncbi:zinc finger protein 84-like [Dunckerocampus dactyliophorus]|uniref:zinc finger protein 84-like n=1 Tax=Dunckerocampus dactyliophorus TaxID=161453 RepID=UPI002404EBA7|nr:zinc finger protein 84-like [Dunckerocampus dactyliophorus]
MLQELVKERLMAAADEIVQLFERTMASYEEELCRTREEKERLRQQLEDVCQTQTVLHFEDGHNLIDRQEERPTQRKGVSSTLKQEEPQHPHIKEEEGELWRTQDGEYLRGPEETDLTKLPLTVVSLKAEGHEDKPPDSSQLHHNPREENSSSSPQHMTTEADGDHCGGSQADLAPLSDNDDTMSHKNDTQEPLSSNADREMDLKTQTDNKDSECSKKKTGKKCSACSVCGESFSNNSALTRHARTHTGEKPFCCSVCGKTFSQKSHMVKHMRTHTGEKPFSCSVCRQRFSQKSNIISHMRTHTGEKPFSCSVCGRRFSEKSNIITHMRTHTGEKPFSCSLCAKTFAERVSMMKHMRTHTGEKPYVCSICDKSFTQKVNMTTHMKTHSGEKPYICSVCDKRFSNKVNMVKHMRTHTGDKSFDC